MASTSATDRQSLVHAIATQHAADRGALMPVLHDVMDEFGHIAREDVVSIAAVLNLSVADVHGVVSFYKDFRTTPPPTHTVGLCRAEACQSVNGEPLAKQFLDRFGVEWGGTTPDGRLTIEATYCLGLCASGPSAMLDGEVIGRLTKDSIDDIAREVG